MTDHQPLKWFQTKHKGKDINPRLQRWSLKLGKYDINIGYIKGKKKKNTVADFLSRINAGTGEICSIDESSRDINLHNISTTATIHSQAEEINNHFPMLDSVVNRFHTQIILTESKTKDIKIVDNKRKIFVSLDDIRSGLMCDIFRRFIKTGKVGIYSGISDSDYNILQQKLIELFNTAVKFYRCSYHAKDMRNEEEVFRYIQKYHKEEIGHGGINENYLSLKNAIYFKNLKTLTRKYINNCDVCCRGKYHRKPHKPKYSITETLKEANEIIHIDTYVIKKHIFITTLVKFSK